MNCKSCRKEIVKDSVFCSFCGKKQATTKRRTKKRENGTGSVYKRDDVKSTPWVAKAPAKLIDGKYERIILGTFATAQEAKDVLDEYNKNPSHKFNATFKTLYKEWLPIATKNSSRKTKKMYELAYTRFESIENEKFRELSSGHYQEILDNLEDDLGHDSLRQARLLIRRLYNYAMQFNIITVNYGQFVTIKGPDKKVKPIFTDLELQTLKDSIGKVKYADWIYFMCYTGLRIGEFVKVNKFSVYEKNGVMALYGGIKTDAGKDKVVPIHDNVKPILRKYMARNTETVFCMDDGSPMTEDHFRRRCFYPTLEELGIQENKTPRRLTPQATRRTFATMLSVAGVKEEDFIAIMGHASFDVTIDHYIFQSAEKLQSSINLLS